jgi:hypothetical protein
MAFENSAATNPSDLIQKLNTFLVANGWTSDLSAADGVGWRVHVHKGSTYAHIRAQMNEDGPFQSTHTVLGYSVCLYVGTGFTIGNAWNDQLTGAPTESGSAGARPVGAGMTMQPGAIPNYYFFTDANDNVAVVVEHVAGIYSNMGWGPSLTKIGTWTGGAYFFASLDGFYIHDTSTSAGNATTETANCPGINASPQAGAACWYVRADVDAFTGLWISGSDTTAANLGYTGKIGSSPILGAANPAGSHTEFPCYSAFFGGTGDFQSNQTSAIDGRANLLPVVLYAQRDGSGTGFSPLGTIPSVFSASAVGQGFSPASDYVIGSDTYTMFPQFAIAKHV